MVALEIYTETKACRACNDEFPLDRFRLIKTSTRECRANICKKCEKDRDSFGTAVLSKKKTLRHKLKEAPYLLLVDLFRENPELFNGVIEKVGFLEFKHRLLEKRKEIILEMRDNYRLWAKRHPNRAKQLRIDQEAAWDKVIKDLLTEIRSANIEQ